MYKYLMEAIRTEYDCLEVLRSGPRGTIQMLRHKRTGTLHVFRHYRGCAEVYRKLLTISSPYLPQIEDAAEHDGVVAVLEEYIQGDPMDELLEGALFTPAEARTILRQLCKALWILHSLGAVHRDVKPENIILRGKDAVLIDFDASRMVKSQQSADTQILGTTGYAAPEQYGMAQTDHRTDIYSLGILLNVMLTGRHPSQTMVKGPLARVVRKCTMLNPNQRYQDVRSLMNALSLF